MPSPELFRIFTRKLEELQLRYAITGSLAAIYYGEPRMTNGVDVVLLMDRGDAERVHRAFPAEHLRDIAGMLDGLGEGWSRVKLDELIREQGLGAQWAMVGAGRSR